MILVDTSVWIEVFRRHRPLDLEAVVPLSEVVTCPRIVQEVLQGMRDESSFRLAETAMTAMPVLDSAVPLERWLQAAQLYARAKAAGVTVRSSVDCLIAACALQHGLELLHRDRDYSALARIAPLRQRRV